MTRLHRYEGPAWYQREVTISAEWAGKRVALLLERTKCAQVWLDGKPRGESPILCTPQEYELGVLPPGKHRLTVCVDNSRRPVQCEMHQMSDNTQGNWNGIIGRIELRATDAVWIEDLQIFPDVAGDVARVVARIGNATKQTVSGTLTMQMFETGARSPALTRAALALFEAAPGGATLETLFQMPNAPRWDEFEPRLLRMTADLKTSTDKDQREVLFGFHYFKTLGSQFNVNGRTTFLRGKHDGCVFPLTGHPPMDVEGWLNYLRTCQDYGINHIRFHTWTPPDAAFTAADQLGMYLQPELPFWGKYDEA
ncbi:MAG: glycoside hydrolase family 2, partial [Kiritimatiellaeota bacterium]|nr:glycoside hydrolase family 2 [Kiritimatiellota bacterium]